MGDAPLPQRLQQHRSCTAGVMAEAGIVDVGQIASVVNGHAAPFEQAILVNRLRVLASLTVERVRGVGRSQANHDRTAFSEFSGHFGPFTVSDADANLHRSNEPLIFYPNQT